MSIKHCGPPVAIKASCGRGFTIGRLRVLSSGCLDQQYSKTHRPMCTLATAAVGDLPPIKTQMWVRSPDSNLPIYSGVDFYLMSFPIRAIP
ncbi:hypothetical protein AVEN_22335-1 [Araneus ventricosus]|uniref:Uncharacterized protein n=1 Tax=Araneus ventricosus TaxID=182803 RepID=A0A4Y2HCA6_ARAVE|nr:hypothetical protein AVEN_22335-1 [Araneus ventricosus]